MRARVNDTRKLNPRRKDLQTTATFAEEKSAKVAALAKSTKAASTWRRWIAASAAGPPVHDSQRICRLARRTGLGLVLQRHNHFDQNVHLFHGICLANQVLQILMQIPLVCG
jgi:hypothetical protein